jgi:hypothetical protein
MSSNGTENRRKPASGIQGGEMGPLWLLFRRDMPLVIDASPNRRPEAQRRPAVEHGPGQPPGRDGEHPPLDHQAGEDQPQPDAATDA